MRISTLLLIMKASHQREIPMQLIINDANTKALLTEVLIEIMHTEKSLFKELLLEAMEEVGLSNAIEEGLQNDFVEEDAIFAALKGQNNASQI